MSNIRMRRDPVSSAADLDVLVVEDNPVYSAWLAGTLRHESNPQHRMQVSESGSLAGARALLNERQFDAVLLDLNLPDSEGLATVVALTALCPQLAIIVVSANDDEHIALKALSQGAQDYIFKGKERETSIFRTLCRSMERKYVELQLAMAKEQALQNERMAAIGMLASGVAHEYNNIGAVILGNADLIAGHHDLPTVVRQRVDVIRDAAQRAGAVTNSLLAFVRGFRDSDDRVAIQAVVHSTRAMVESTVKQHGVVLEIEMPAQPIEVIGNASILGQVLMNLLINACHAMANAVIRQLRVVITLDQSGTGVDIRVIDTGHGISSADHERIFLPFFTTKNTGGDERGIRGTGLGLAVCRTFVEQHRGTITVTSQPGLGSVFRVWLPTAVPVVRPEAPMETTPVSVAGRHVLLVDDEPAVGDFLSLVFNDMGLVTTRAETVAHAIAHLETLCPDAVVTDWQMPGATGRVLIEYLLALPPDRRPAIIVSSGNLPQVDHGWLVEQTGITILDKPVPLRDLQAAIRRVLGQNR